MGLEGLLDVTLQGITRLVEVRLMPSACKQATGVRESELKLYSIKETRVTEQVMTEPLTGLDAPQDHNSLLPPSYGIAWQVVQPLALVPIRTGIWLCPCGSGQIKANVFLSL